MSALAFGEIRLAIRRLRKDAGTSIAAVAALAFAIGAAVATWSLLSAVLLKPLHLAEPEQLFQVGEAPPPNIVNWWVPGHTYPVYESIRDSGAFDAIAAVGTTFRQPLLVIDQGEVPQGRQVHFAAHDFFATLGVEVERGRTFTQEDDRRGAPLVAVLSDHYWRRVFNADATVLGRAVTVAGATATVIGILPRDFRGLQLSEAPDLYLPLHVAGDLPMVRPLFFNRDPLEPGGSAWIRIVGRLRPGEIPDAAAARLNALDCLCGRELTQGDVGPLVLTNVNTAAVPELVRGGTTQFTTLLSSTVGLLLLIGCLTVGMLLLVRTEDRRDELAVRLALGATRSRLAVSIVVEAAILCALGALLAVPVALWLSYGIRAFQLPGAIDVERLELGLAAGPWLAVTGIALAATGAIALLATLVGVGGAVGSPLQSRVLAAPRVTRRAPRTVLVAGQVAITLVLVTGAGLFTRSLIEALNLNPGIETDRIVTAGLDLTPYGYTRESAAPFVDELRDRLRANALIESVSIVVPAGAVQSQIPITVDGVPRELPSTLQYQAVEDDYFSTFGLPIVNGRAIARSDIESSALVAVVSESLGRFIADGGSPLGRRIPDWESIRQTRAGQPRISLEVIGVVPDVIVNVNATAPLVVYQPLPPMWLRGFGGTTLAVRAAGEPAAVMREAQAVARALDSQVTLQNMATLDAQIGRQMNPQRFGVYVLGALGGIALLLTVLSTYVIAQSMVVRRRRELGIRAALGARNAQLRRLVLRDTARLVGIGLMAGLALAAAGARLIRSLLYQVEPLDPLVLAAVAAGIFGLALLVSLRPALEAARVDLTRSLREE